MCVCTRTCTCVTNYWTDLRPQFFIHCLVPSCSGTSACHLCPLKSHCKSDSHEHSTMRSILVMVILIISPQPSVSEALSYDTQHTCLSLYCACCACVGMQLLAQPNSCLRNLGAGLQDQTQCSICSSCSHMYDSS